MSYQPHLSGLGGRSNLVDLELLWCHETEKAILVQIQEGRNEDKVWLPKSLVEYSRRSGGVVEVTMTQSLAEEKGLV